MSSKSRKTAYADSVLGKLESSNCPPWPEWLDSELNSEPWDYPKGGEFSDPREISMPLSLQPTEWKRFRQLRYVTAPIVYDENSNYPDLITNNRHLLHSEFVRCFVSTLVNLQYCGRNGLEIESPSSNFSWNLADRCWQGWFNVYSLNKAGKGANHRPLINSNGRYVVRLFHMGGWRKILVDDSIPLDKNGRSLLPCTANPNELWPLILGKALLKVAALSWTLKREIADCSLITCLTGWVDLSLKVSHLSPRDQWEFLIKYVKHFEWPRVDNEKANQSKLEKSAKPRKSKSQGTTLLVPEGQQPVLLFLNLENSRDADINEIPGITPCWNHQIYVLLSRDVPLDPMQVKKPLAQWKIYRWLDWAIRHGLTDASDYFVPTRHLLVVSPLGKCRNDFLYAYDETEDIGEEDLSKDTLESGEKYNGKSGNDMEPGSPDISLWADFNKLSFYLHEVHLFYRQKFFKYSVEFSNTVENSLKDGKKSARKTSGPPQNVDKIYEYRDDNSESRNEPLYLFVDSLQDKFFLINFTTTAERPGSKMSSLIIEKHNWFKKVEDKSIADLKTRGTLSMVFQLKPGRHLLRIFVNSQSSYHSILMSDTPFQIGNRLKMHELMTTEADRINEAARKIDNSIKKAFESFGTDNYSSELKIYYQSYMPEVLSTLDKKELKILKAIHGWSIVELFRLIDKHFSQADLPTVRRAIRIFFLDPSIGVKPKSDELSSNDTNEENLEIIKDVSESNQAACLIQSFFRTIVLKSYKEIHRASHEEHRLVRETLMRVAQLFNDEQKSVANALLRGIVKCDKFLESLYPWVDDVQHVVHIQDFFGIVTYGTANQWIPIVRTIVNVEKSETVFATLHLFTDLFNYTVRVFANDTNQEMSRHINNVEPNRYGYRKNGYTIFAYGLGNFQKYKELEWSLHSVTIKGEPIFCWIDGIESHLSKKQIFPLCVKEISDIYVPNVQNCIFRIIANVREKCLVSLRLTTSYENVMTKLRIIRKNGEVLEEIEGGRTLILPVVFLELDEVSNETEPLMRDKKVSKPRKSASRRSGGSVSNRYGNVLKRDTIEPGISETFTQYTIEAFILEDSWPLTKDEWAVVMRAKTRLDVTVRDRKSTSGRKVERPKNSFKQSLQLGSILEEPYWSLQIVLDSENKLEISQDTSKKDKIAEMRKIWDTEESGRSERGRKLREKFLKQGATGDEIQDQFYETDETKESTDSSLLKISTMAKRTLKPPLNFRNNLSKFDLTIYMEKDNEEEDRWVKSDYDEETLGNQRAMNVLDFQQSQMSFLEESADIMEKRRDKYRRLIQRLMENYHDRSRDIDEAYRVRQAYIESIKNTVRPVKSKESLKQKKDH